MHKCDDEGDGVGACESSQGQLQVPSNYTNAGIGSLACEQGEDVAYPEGAPGYLYDPTGYLLTLPGREVRTRD